jgi:hypothetical protein
MTIFYIVYGSSIADENSEISESKVNQFLALPASPSPLPILASCEDVGG